MEYAEQVYECVKQLPAEQAREVLDFAEFLAVRFNSEAASLATTHVDHRTDIEQAFAKYRIDLSDFKFNREEANARR